MLVLVLVVVFNTSKLTHKKLTPLVLVVVVVFNTSKLTHKKLTPWMFG
jgi:hypothetical protein